MSFVLDDDVLFPQHLNGTHDPATPEAARALDIRTIEERRIESEQTARFERLADLTQHLVLVLHQMNRIEEDDGVGGGDETR